MRDLNECQAEVFRRSEKRIKERRKTATRTLALCIPLCLALIVSSVTVFPERFSAKDKSTAPESNMGAVGNVDGSSSAYVRVEIISTWTAIEQGVLKDDPHEVAQIYYSVQAAFARGGEEDKKAEYNGSDKGETQENHKENILSGTMFQPPEYRIVFIAGDERKVTYFLGKDKLINEATGEKVALSEDAYFNLLRLLGVTITEEAEPR